VIVYAESSAVLAWLLGEEPGELVRQTLIEADAVVSSDLTLIECDRAIHRGAALGGFSAAVAADLKSRLASAVSNWNIMRIAPQIVARAREPFSNEPIRTLDAIHVATALYARSAIPGIVLLTLDGRIRRVGRSLGFALAPE
jgi:predicted nucleic acid-binding protein